MCKSCLDDHRLNLPNLRKPQKSEAEVHFKEWMCGKYHRSLKRKLMLFSQKGQKPCRTKSNGRATVHMIEPMQIRRSVDTFEMQHEMSVDQGTPDTVSTPIAHAETSLTRKFSDSQQY
jgi:hypothetical protein